MKITAEFDSTDSAERACTAIRHTIGGITDMKIRNGNYKDSFDEYTIFPNISPAYGSMTFYVPTYTVAAVSWDDNIDKEQRYEPQRNLTAKVEIICPQESKNSVKSALVNYGGLSVKCL